MVGDAAQVSDRQRRRPARQADGVAVVQARAGRAEHGGGVDRRITGRFEGNQWLRGYVSSCIMRIGRDSKVIPIADSATAVKRVSSVT